MNCEEFKYYQFDYLKGTLPDDLSNQIADHLIDCTDCRLEIKKTSRLMDEATSLRKSISPEKDLWPDIEKRIGNSGIKKITVKIFKFFDHNGNSNGELKIYKAKRGKFLVTAGAISILIAGFSIGYFYFNQTKPGFWAVQNIQGKTKIDSEIITDAGILKVGDWLETDSNSRARIKVGVIGEVDVDPDSKVKLIETKPTEHRISLSEGKIHAAIWSPPRVFFVETPSATAIDLGCMYTLEVDENGSSFLRVTSGWVAFNHNGRESVIPQGAVCETRETVGPGTPYFEDASDMFISSLSKYDFEKKSEENLEIILNNSRVEDQLSLWHLLAKANNDGKRKIFFRMKELSEIPDEISLAGILNNDKKMLDIWWEELGYGSRSLWNNFKINN